MTYRNADHSGPVDRPTLPYLAVPVPVAFAHRGFTPQAENSSTSPGKTEHSLENTMAAFTAAVDLGFSYLESDVRSTADGVLVLFHDRSVRRVTGSTGMVQQLSYQQLSQLRVNGTESIPRLVDVLDGFPQVKFNLDIKDDASVVPLAELVEQDRLHDRLCIASLSSRRRRKFLKLLSRPIATPASVSAVAAFLLLAPWAPRSLLRWVLRDANCLQIPHRIGSWSLASPRILARAHQLGKPVHVWTVDDPERMRELLEVGVDGIMTDRADLLAQVMVERGYRQYRLVR